jgi:hypothetical protein
LLLPLWPGVRNGCASDHKLLLRHGGLVAFSEWQLEGCAHSKSLVYPYGLVKEVNMRT